LSVSYFFGRYSSRFYLTGVLLLFFPRSFSFIVDIPVRTDIHVAQPHSMRLGRLWSIGH
jgi:hypothetical protein